MTIASYKICAALSCSSIPHGEVHHLLVSAIRPPYIALFTLLLSQNHCKPSRLGYTSLVRIYHTSGCCLTQRPSLGAILPVVQRFWHLLSEHSLHLLRFKRALYQLQGTRTNRFCRRMMTNQIMKMKKGVSYGQRKQVKLPKSTSAHG